MPRPSSRYLLHFLLAGVLMAPAMVPTAGNAQNAKSTDAPDCTSFPCGRVETIRQVHSGKKRVPPEVASHLAEHMGDEPLTTRELDVLRHVSDGNRNRDIAKRLFISEETVKVHIKHIMEKLGASDRTEAVTIAVRRGIIQL